MFGQLKPFPASLGQRMVNAMKNPEILRKIGCVPTLKTDGGHDFLLPLTSNELSALQASLPSDTPIVTVSTPTGLALRFRPNEGLTRDVLALANLRGITSENAQGDGI